MRWQARDFHQGMRVVAAFERQIAQLRVPNLLLVKLKGGMRIAAHQSALAVLSALSEFEPLA